MCLLSYLDPATPATAGMEGGLKEEQRGRELKAMGLKWGQLTSGQVELWEIGKSDRF